MSTNNPNEYNGYPNYQTWVVALWIDNEQATQEYWQEQAQELLSTNSRNKAIQELADLLQEDHNYAAFETTGISVTGVFADLMNYALGSVDWWFIADGMISELAD